MKTFLVFILFFAFSGCFSQNITELQTELKNVLEDMHVPGMSVALVHRDGLKWAAGIGKADLAKNQEATADTLFRIGSVSKGFVSLAILKLVEEGKLSLDDSVKKLAPEVWFENNWETTDPVRVVNLLENTTGWDDMHLREFAKDPLKISSFDALDFDHSSRICRWRPGTRMAYCNSGPAVAAYIVEKMTGLSFEDYARLKFFKPMGMETATYFQPSTAQTTTLYHSDGKTPHAYWNLLYRPIGSLNASAHDMANYLLFYLNRGHVQGTQVMPAVALERMEQPSSTWAAQEGLRVGYGMHNYCVIHDGFVYQGHDGNVPGGLTAMAYMPGEGVGYFYSINSENRQAFEKIGEVIRAYLTRSLQKPSALPVVSLSEKANDYAGWYEPNSPRMNLFYFIERLMGLAYVHFEDNKLFVSSLGEKNAEFLPVSQNEFSYVPKNKSPDPMPTLKLLTAKPEGQFIQLGLGLITMKRIPTWFAAFEIFIVGLVLLTFTSILVYAPFWMMSGLNKKHRRPVERSLRLWPLLGVLSLVAIIVISMLSSDEFLVRLGNLTVWSFSLFVATIAFAVSSLASVIALWHAPKSEVRGVFLAYSTIVTIALVISTAYFAYYGIIGFRTWT